MSQIPVSEGNLYFSVFEGTFRRKLKQPTNETVTRENKNGSIVHELIFEALTGKITGVETSTYEDYEFLQIKVSDEDENYIISLSLNSGYARTFLFRLPNIYLANKIKFLPFLKDDKAHMVIYQGPKLSTKVLQKWTKEEQGDLPPWREIQSSVSGGKSKWDNSDQMAYLIDMVNGDILPQLNGEKPFVVPEWYKEDTSQSTDTTIVEDEKKEVINTGLPEDSDDTVSYEPEEKKYEDDLPF